MNNLGCGIVAFALLAISPNVAFGQKEKQIPQQFMGMWCDTGNDGTSFSISFRPIKKSEDCTTKQVLELSTDFLNLYNDDAKTTCLLVTLDSVNSGKVEGKFVCATRNNEAKRTYTTQEVYELTFEHDKTLRLRDMERVDQK